MFTLTKAPPCSLANICLHYRFVRFISFSVILKKKLMKSAAQLQANESQSNMNKWSHFLAFLSQVRLWNIEPRLEEVRAFKWRDWDVTLRLQSQFLCKINLKSPKEMDKNAYFLRRVSFWVVSVFLGDSMSVSLDIIIADMDNRLPASVGLLCVRWPNL